MFGVKSLIIIIIIINNVIGLVVFKLLRIPQ